MHLAGKYIVHASPAKVWAFLMNADKLAKVIPGISRLEPTGINIFKTILEIKLGPVSGAFTGNLQLEDINEPNSFTLKAQQNSKIGNANTTVKINLQPAGTSETEVSFDGDVKLSGTLAALGQRVMSGVSGTLTKQFFTNLENELSKTTAL